MGKGQGLHAPGLLVVSLSFLWTGMLPAQQAVADSLWRLGRRGEAVDEYRRILAADSNAVRANFRVAEALAGSNVDSALRFLRNARSRVPDDPDLMFTEAKYLSWARRFDDAVLRYDSLLMAHPEFDYVRVARARVLSWNGQLDAAGRGYRDVLDRTGADAGSRRDAQFGLAQVAAWQGNLVEAAERYADLLADDPGEVRSLVGLAAVRNWQGRPFAASALLDRALALEPDNPDAKLLKASATQSRAPTLSLSASWSHDSDDNDVAWQTATQGFVVRDGTRISGTVGYQRAVDPARRTTRLSGEVLASVSPRSMQLTVALGARQLAVDVAPAAVADRTEVTWRAIVSARPSKKLAIGVAASHVPFDEIAALLARGIDITNYEATVEWLPRSGSATTLSAGTMDFSDGNTRTSAALRFSLRARPSLTLGALARTFSFAHDAVGYFTPEQFMLGDLYGAWEGGGARWSTGISGGGGVQRLGPDDPVQSQWHFDARAGRRFGRGASLELFGGTSTSAAASAVGAFRYQTMGLSARIPF